MCGLAGFFLGCTQPCHSRGMCHQSSGYRSPFAGWREKAGVYVDNSVSDDTPISDEFFPEGMVPVIGHPLIASLTRLKQNELLRLYLLRYLSFTVRLETSVVNDVMASILNGDYRGHLNTEALLDAYKVYLDEAYHSMMCAHAIARVTSNTNQSLPDVAEFPYIKRYNSLIASNKNRKNLNRHAMIIVSELLITPTLTSVGAHSEGIHCAVRDVIRRHAVDEGRHHNYFGQYLIELWANLSVDDRIYMGQLMPEAISAFLTPDFQNMNLELQFIGLSSDDARHVIEETYIPNMVAQQKRASAGAVLTYMKFLEIDRLPGVQDALDRHELS